jgi:ATP/maltotriose-dependent transcriptional regulator MalT
VSESWDIVGRDAELAELRSLLGTEASIVVIDGPAGVGKTTLLSALLREVQSGMIRRARGFESEVFYAFTHLADLLDDALTTHGDLLPHPQRRALEVAFLRAEAQGPPPDGRAVAVASLELCRNVAAGQPLLLAIDDLQWVDSSTAAVLSFIARRTTDDPIQIFATWRSSEDLPDLALEQLLRGSEHRVVRLGGIDRRSLGVLLERHLGQRQDRRRVRAIHDAVAGNPMFAIELGRSQWNGPDDAPTGSLPPSLAHLMDDRLASLTAQERTALRIIGVLGHPAIGTLEKALSAVGAETSIVRDLVEDGLLRLADGRIDVFHPLLRTVVLDNADPRELQELHRLLAGAAETEEERARHLALATDEPDAAIADALATAAEGARARGAVDAAADLAELAVDLTPPFLPELIVHRLLIAGEHRFVSGDAERSRVLLDRAVEQAASGPARGEALLALGLYHHRSESFVRAEECHRQGLAEPGLSNGLASDLHRELGYALLFQGRLAEARAEAEQAAALARSTGDPVRIFASQVATGTARFLMGEGFDESERRQLVASPIATRFPLIRQPRFIGALGDAYSGSLDAARTEFEALLDEAQLAGDEGSMPMLLTVLAEAELMLGRSTEAERHLRTALELASDMHQDVRRAAALGFLGRLEAQRGDFGSAAQRAELGLELALRVGSMNGIMLSMALRGWILFSRGDIDGAAAAYGPLCDAIVSRGVIEPSVVRWIPDAAEVFATGGDIARATGILDPFEDRARVLGRTSMLAMATRARALTLHATGSRNEALELLEEALQLHREAPEPFEVGRTELALGTLLRRSRAKRAARDVLGSARRRFEETSATWWVERCDLELDGIGAPAAPVGELTPTEHRVAEQVAAGRSNREVAANLLMSPKTVEAHLSRIYRKLGVRSRTELAARLGSLGNP